jgi:energy-coupling factor transporter ATP-binding protein EcfA2
MYGVVLIYYAYCPYILLHKYSYFFENIFFNFFALMGLILPLIFLNQFAFLLALIGLLSFDYLCKYFFMELNCLGVWQQCPRNHWIYLILIVVLYIVISALHDVLHMTHKKNSQEKNYSDEEEEIKKSSIKSSSKTIPSNTSMFRSEVKYKDFTAEDMEAIYNTIPISKIKEEILTERILSILETFFIFGSITQVLTSASVTNYFFKPKIGTKTSRIESIEEELSIELSRNVRIAISIKGIIFEVANNQVQSFSFKNLWSSEKLTQNLPLFLGFDTFGEKIIMDLSKQPHILMCGTTGSGKSSTLHAIIHSLLTKKSPKEVQFLLIDPKILELSIYKNIPHLWQDIVTSVEEAEKKLKLLVEEMESRYKIISQHNKRSIIEFNKDSSKPFSYIVFCIEEFADLVIHKNNNFKTLVQRLAQMGRAAGIHGIICTQRPSANVVDGVIKANFPTRIALKVSNKLESRIILDMGGAERLSNPGEMIIVDSLGITRRAIAPYITEGEILRLIKRLE